MKRILFLCLAAAGQAALADASHAAAPKFNKLVLSSKFYSEGAYYADFNRDGALDVVAGPLIFLGPDFKNMIEYRPGKEFDPKEYSDHFMTFAGDFNGDGWPDVLAIPFPGKQATWYQNPAGKPDGWKAHDTGIAVDGESPGWADVNKDGRPDLIHCMGGSYGYSVFDPAAPDKPWTFVPVTQGGGYERFTHGQGCGDVNGDGRMDLLESSGWWEQPAGAKPGAPWKKHPVKFADTAAQLLVADIDADGLNDVITSHHAHRYGLTWHRQARGADGEIAFEQHVILPSAPDLNSSALRISQMHALDLADFNCDGVPDFVTGKRRWAHGPAGDPEPSAPSVLYWFEGRRNADKSVSFIPHEIDSASGVGVQVAAVDMNGDKVPDVVVGCKNGIFVFLSSRQ